MGWLHVYVSFAEYRLFYRALLQKRPIILKSLLIVATPYHVVAQRSEEMQYYFFRAGSKTMILKPNPICDSW